jgi:phosphate butyryltransferase
MGLISSLKKVKSNKQTEKIKIAVVKAADEEVLHSIKRGLEDGMIEPVLIDDAKELKDLMAKLDISLNEVKIIDEADDKKAAEKGVELVRAGEVGSLMKGFIGTGDFLRPVVNKEMGIRSSSLLSHVAVLYVEKLKRFLAITDGGMVIQPNKEEYKTIIDHGVKVMKSINIKKPKAALLSASENVIPIYEPSMWASELTNEMNNENFVVEGPISLDLALVPEIAEQKNYQGKIQGDAAVIVTPEIASGNSLAKSLTIFGESEMAGLIIGATVPIILTSRSSSSNEKYGSILLARHYMDSE